MRGMQPLRSLASIGIGIALAALAGPAAAGPAQQHSIRLGMVVDDRVSPAARYLTATIAEADAIWRPHGVSVMLARAGDLAPDVIRLALTFEPVPRVPRQKAALGSIWFDEEGLPGNVLAVDLSAVTGSIRQSLVGGRVFEQWPPDLMTGRALGRVLAHEIGHYVLASPAHARTGLMRAVFNSRDLAAWDRRHFALDDGARARLQARLAQLDGGQKPLGPITFNLETAETAEKNP